MKQILILAAFVSAGCASTQSGRLYSLKDGRTASVIISDARSAKGSVTAWLPTGERCNGEFTTFDGDEPPAIADSSAIGESAERGFALLSCGSATLIKCALARRPGETFSYGTCKDQSGVEYAMMF